MEEQKREQARAREELVIILENLQKELKLRSVTCGWTSGKFVPSVPLPLHTHTHGTTSTCRTLIVDNFVPPEVAQRVRDRAVYNEEEETWTMAPFRAVERWFTHTAVVGPVFVYMCVLCACVRACIHACTCVCVCQSVSISV